MPPLLIQFWVGIMALTALSVACAIVMTRLHHSPHPWGVPFFWGDDVGFDLTVFRERFLHFRQPGFWNLYTIPLIYPAPIGVVLALLFQLPHPLAVYLIVCVAGVAGWIIWLVRNLAAQQVAPGPATIFALTVAATSWPLWVLFNTANLEGLVAILLATGILAFLARRWWLAATLIGLAGAMKLFPLILLALLLSQRRYREFAAGLAVALATTIFSLAILGPSIPEAQRNLSAGLRIVTNADALAPTSTGPDTNHSLYVVVRYAVLLAHHRHPHDAAADPKPIAAILRPAYNTYLLLAALAGIAAYFLRIRHLPLLNQILALTLCAVTLPPVSRDYTLLHLLVPFGLLCLAAASDEGQPGLRACFVCFAFIFTAGTCFNFGPSLASPIRAVFLLALLVFTLKYPFHAAYLDEPPHPTHV
jgi:hypothetical protein